MKIEVEILTPLDYRDMGDGKQVMILRPFLVKLTQHYKDGTIEVRIIEVPAGFISDFASIPRFIQGLFPRFGKYNAAAIVHDWLFIHGKIEGRPIEQKLADRIFLAIMRKTKCGWRKTPMYIAVRMFGRHLWNKNRRNESDIPVESPKNKGKI